MGRSLHRIVVLTGVTLLVIAGTVMLVTPASATVTHSPTDSSSIVYASNESGTNTSTNGGTNATVNDTTPDPEPEFELSVTANAERIVVGDPYVVEVTVRNVGNEAGTKGVEFDAEGSVVSTRNVSLVPGASKTVRFTYRFAEAGNETVEIDHSIQRTVVVEPREANLTVGDVSLEDDTVEPSEPFRITATVTNDGLANGTQEVELMLYGQVVDVQTVTVAPNETEQVTFTHRIDQPGTYTASVGGEQREVRVTEPDTATATPTRTATTPATGSAPGFGLSATVTALAALVTALLVGRHRTR